MKLKNLIVALVATTIVLGACVPATEAPASAGQLENTRWVLQALDHQPPLGSTTLTAEFSSGVVGGSAGCNSYSGSYKEDGSGLTIAEVAVTEMYCLDPEGVMGQERDFLAALTSVANYRRSADGLELLDATGEVVLAFAQPAPMPEVTLEETEWSLTTFVDGETAASLTTGTAITLVFAEGRVAGSAGCNEYSGPYTLEQGALRIGAIGLTKMACTEPAGVMEQEADYINALQEVTSLELDANQLTLRTAGRRELVFTADS